MGISVDYSWLVLSVYVYKLKDCGIWSTKMVSLPLKFIRSTSKIFYVSSLKKSFRHHFRFANIFFVCFSSGINTKAFFSYFSFYFHYFDSFSFALAFALNSIPPIFAAITHYTTHLLISLSIFFYFLWFFLRFEFCFFFIYWKKNQTKTIIFHFSLVDFLFWLGSIRHSMFQNNPSVWSIVVCA